MEEYLFDIGRENAPSQAKLLREAKMAVSIGGKPRLRLPQRDQVEMHWLSLDELLEPSTRLAWCGPLSADRSGPLVGGTSRRWRGTPVATPRTRGCWWLSGVYATLDGISSAEKFARLCEKHLAYQWLCGGVSVNHRLLSDFRSQAPERWDDLLTQIIGALLAENLVTIRRVAQDGMRVRADAGSSSFRRKPRLQQCLGRGAAAGGGVETAGRRVVGGSDTTATGGTCAGGSRAAAAGGRGRAAVRGSCSNSVRTARKKSRPESDEARRRPRIRRQGR